MAIIDNLNDEITLGLRKLRGEAPSGRLFLMDGTRVEAEPDDGFDFLAGLIRPADAIVRHAARSEARKAQMDEGLKLAHPFGKTERILINGVEHLVDGVVTACEPRPSADVQTGFVAAYVDGEALKDKLASVPPPRELWPGIVIRQFQAECLAEAKAQAELDYALQQVMPAMFPFGG